MLFVPANSTTGTIKGFGEDPRGESWLHAVFAYFLEADGATASFFVIARLSSRTTTSSGGAM